MGGWSICWARAAIPVLGVVENMTHVICPNCGELIELYPAPAKAKRLTAALPVLASVPFHPHLIRQNWREAAALGTRSRPRRRLLLLLADAVIAQIETGRRTAPPATTSEDCEDCP